ncbi:chemotaxis protein CheW [Limnoglobus roseus]|uniref:Chemotaxis protein CheW n=1 Tax=Limnoglobus roseus TaxID=2598579 RepID=A0A5C1AI28_9BACT|nr:chemotaxis protein CheW [Limnoglobus roseus]QEL16618.1 chemotaxis protein CheW [Limnoglobus roseus]
MTPKRRRIDWDQLRTRLAAAREAAADHVLSPERVEAIYRERAEALARPRTEADRASGFRVLEVEVGGERFGVDLRDVAEVLPFDGGTPVPGGPSELVGVVNVRGDLRSVTDLGRLLGVTGSNILGFVVLIRGAEAALRVDRAEAVRTIELAADARPDSPFVRGVTADRLRVLDTAALLAHPVFRGPSGKE